MPRVLDLPDAEHVQFPNAPLKAMLGQIRFPTILKIASPAGLADFQEELRPDYPEYGEEQQLNLAIGPGGMSPAGESKNVKFSTSDGGWSVVLNPTFLTLEASIAKKYSNYAEFRDRFAQVWDAALRHLGPTKSVQQGLRYIDFFDWDDVTAAEWGRYLSPPLLGLLGADALVGHVEHTLTDARLQLNDEMAISLKYGLVRGGPDNVLGFLLDTDCLSETTQEDASVDAVLGRFDAFHDEIHVLFHWAVTPDAKERFSDPGARND